MNIFEENTQTGLSCGINDDGKLFLGDDKSGYNLPDTPANRERIKEEFYSHNIKEINAGLEIVKLENEPFKVNGGQALYSGYALKHSKGYISFKGDGEEPYVPLGGEKALQEILDAGGFRDFRGMQFVQSLREQERAIEGQNYKEMSVVDNLLKRVNKERNAAVTKDMLLDSIRKSRSFNPCVVYAFQKLGSEQVPGLRLADCEVTGKLFVMLKQGMITDKDWEKHVMELEKNNAISKGVNRMESEHPTRLAAEKQIQVLYKEGKNSNEVAKKMFLNDYSKEEIVNALMKYAPNMPERSDEARKVAQKIVRSAEREIAKHDRKVKPTEISR